MNKGLAWKLLLFCGGVLCGLPSLTAQSCGSSDTTIVNANNQLVRTLTISDYINDDLADPAQGLCGVEINFVHQYVENLEITLTSPAGQMVNLIGPNSDSQFDFTLFTQWRVSFVPCAELAEPDNLFAPRWDNEQTQNWASGGLYTGSYYPYQGCLEDFNFGAVNGDWTFTVNNNPSNNPGAITSIRLIFCDSRGVDCCEALGGSIRNADILACTATDTLNITTTSRFPLGPADSLEYGYTYALARNDVLIEWDSAGQFDLRTATAGTYEICGLSYRRTQADSLPVADGTANLSALRADLNSLVPRFCGDLSENCQRITIVAPPDTTFLNRRICAGDSVQLGESFFHESGRYRLNLPGYAACDSIVQLDLEVEPLSRTDLAETICAGDSLSFGGMYYHESGIYRDTLPTVELGCDSVVTLSLTVLPPLSTTIRPVICAGQELVVGDSVFQSTGIYRVPLMSREGCDSLVTVELQVLNPQVTINGRDTLDCVNTEALLRRVSNQGNTTGVLRWMDALGESLGTTPEIVVNNGGWYYLELTLSLNETTCLAVDSFFVTDLRQPVVADAGEPQTITCREEEVLLGGNSSMGPNMSYEWSVVPSLTLSPPTNQPFLSVGQAGTYQLIVTDTLSQCVDTSTVIVRVDTTASSVDLGPTQILNCAHPLDTLDCSANLLANHSWQWSGPCIEEEFPDAQISVSCAGWYVVQVVNIENGCATLDSILVTEDFTAPVAEILTPDTINCIQDSVWLEASPLNSGLSLSYQWILPDGSRSEETQLHSGQGGVHRLILTNIATACTDTATAMVMVDTLAPEAGTLSAAVLSCSQPNVVLQAVGGSIGPEMQYNWFEEETLLSAADTSSLLVMEPATYLLEVLNFRNQCRDSVSVVVEANFDSPPFFALGPDREMRCGDESLTIYPDSSSFAGLALEWGGPCLSTTPIGQWAQEVRCPGIYTLTVTRQDNGCSSTDTIVISEATDFARAILPDSVQLSCVDATAMINTEGSSNGLYRWTRNGVPIDLGDDNPRIGGTGIYRLIVENSTGNCADTATTIAYFDCQLSANISPPMAITCEEQSVVLDASASSGEGVYSYEWLAPEGCYLGTLNGSALEVLCTGEYQLILTHSVSEERDTTSVQVIADNSLPQFTLPSTVELNCEEPEQLLDPDFTSNTANLTFRWTDLEENLLADTDTLGVSQAGTYVFEAMDVQTGCSAIQFVTVTADSNLPTIAIGSDVFPCTQDTFILQAFISPRGVSYDINWSGPAIRGAVDQAAVILEQAGFYEISVRNPDNGCSSSLEVEVVPQSCEPCIELAVPDTLGCVPAAVTLTAQICSPCANCNLSWYRDGVLIPGADSLRLPISQAGNYRVQIMDEQGLVSHDSAQVVAYPEVPSFDFGAARMLTCANPSITLTVPLELGVGEWDYRWERILDNALLGTDSLQDISESGAYRLTVEDLRSGCSYAAIVQVEENVVVPEAEAGPDLLLDCNRTVVIPDPTGTTLEGVSYRWRGPAGCLSGAGVLRPAFSCAGTYYLTVSREDNGCTATDSLVVSQTEDLPELSPISDSTLTCSRRMLTLSGTLPTDGANYEARWCKLDDDGNELTFTCEFSTTYLVEEAGDYTFIVTNLATGCASSEQVRVSMDTLPPAVEAGLPDTLLCNLNSLNLLGQAAANSTVQWLSPDGHSIDNAQTLAPTISQAGWYVLEAADSLNGCVGQDSVRVFADEHRPMLEAGPDTNLTCADPVIQLQANGVTSSGDALWQWTSLENEPLVNPTNSSVSISTPGNYVIQLTDPANDCSLTDTVQVSRDFRQPTAIIDTLEAIGFDCRTDTVTLSAANSTSATGGELSYQWSIQGSGNLFPDLSVNTVQSDQPGLYRLIVVDEGNGCRDSLPFQLRGNYSPPDFSLDTDVLPLTCQRDSVLLSLTSVIPATELSFRWQSPNGNIVGAEATVWARQPGVYQVTATRLDNGCSQTDSLDVVAEADFPSVRIRQPLDLSCEQNSVSLDGSGSQEGEFISYTWEVLRGGPLLGTGGSAIDSVANPGSYMLVVTNTTNGCSSQDSVRVERIDNPITALNLVAEDLHCQPGPLGSISVEGITGGTPPYSYQLNDNMSSLVSFFDDLSAGEYELLVRDALGCDYTTVVNLFPAPELLLELGEDVEVVLGDSIELKPLVSRPVLDYRWQAVDRLSGPSPILYPSKSQFVALTVVDSLGCLASDTLFVQVLEDLPIYTPTVFSPSGNGQNAYFTLYDDGYLLSIRKLQIFSRWGNLVFERTNFPTNQPTLGWDGRHNGQLLNSAVFVWMAEVELVNGEVRQLTGDILLMR